MARASAHDAFATSVALRDTFNWRAQFAATSSPSRDLRRPQGVWRRG